MSLPLRQNHVNLLITPGRLLLCPLAMGNIGGAIASVAAGTPPPTAPPLGKGRPGNMAVRAIQQLMPNGQLCSRGVGGSSL
ncbi:MAG: hypothetical protein AAGE59_17945, partial [Cyanobacteria bacterium P01_F01_bin.86]